jgi:predicted transcriptional regulator
MPRRKVVKQVPVGKKIKKARTSKKIKLDQLANETGFSIDYLKDIESGKAIQAALRPIPSEPKITPTRP